MVCPVNVPHLPAGHGAQIVAVAAAAALAPLPDAPEYPALQVQVNVAVVVQVQSVPLVHAVTLTREIATRSTCKTKFISEMHPHFLTITTFDDF